MLAAVPLPIVPVQLLTMRTTPITQSQSSHPVSLDQGQDSPLTCTGCPPTRQWRCPPGPRSSSCTRWARRRRRAWPSRLASAHVSHHFSQCRRISLDAAGELAPRPDPTTPHDPSPTQFGARCQGQLPNPSFNCRRCVTYLRARKVVPPGDGGRPPVEGTARWKACEGEIVLLGLGLRQPG